MYEMLGHLLSVPSAGILCVLLHVKCRIWAFLFTRLCNFLDVLDQAHYTNMPFHNGSSKELTEHFSSTHVCAFREGCGFFLFLFVIKTFDIFMGPLKFVPIAQHPEGRFAHRWDKARSPRKRRLGIKPRGGLKGDFEDYSLNPRPWPFFSLFKPSSFQHALYVKVWEGVTHVYFQCLRSDATKMRHHGSFKLNVASPCYYAFVWREPFTKNYQLYMCTVHTQGNHLGVFLSIFINHLWDL